jgi:DNA-binding response OmpR family regulator
MRRYLSQALVNGGYAVDTAADGVEGLTLAELNDYDVVLLDLMLPRMNGFDVLKRLRSANRDVPVTYPLRKGYAGRQGARLEAGRRRLSREAVRPRGIAGEATSVGQAPIWRHLLDLGSW